MNNEPTERITLKNWAADDRPREKMVQKGTQSLSDAELIAILISSGTRTETAVELARRVLQQSGNNLNELGRLSLNELQRIKGIGQVKAITIKAAFELGKRRRYASSFDQQALTSSNDAYVVMEPYLTDLSHEEVWVVYLNRANKPIRKDCVSRGGITGTVVDNRLILKNAIDLLATGMILFHNHPSGNLQPSEADKQITQRLAEASKLFDIQLLDHLIVASKGYYSFADEGLLTL